MCYSERDKGRSLGSQDSPAWDGSISESEAVFNRCGAERCALGAWKRPPVSWAGDTELPRVRAGPVPAETACPAPLSRTVPRDGRRSFRPCLPSSALVCLQPHPSSAPAPCTLHQQTLLLLLTRTVVFVGLFILLEFFFFLAVLQGLWELSSQARDETCFLNSKSRSPNHWTSRESPLCF